MRAGNACWTRGCTSHTITLPGSCCENTSHTRESRASLGHSRLRDEKAAGSGISNGDPREHMRAAGDF